MNILVFTDEQIKQLLLSYWYREPPDSMEKAKICLDRVISEAVIRQKLERLDTDA
jgi:hypothetical protein